MAATTEAVCRASTDLEELLDDVAGLLGDLIGCSDTGTPALESSGRYWDLLHGLKRRHGAGLSVALLALAKSGELSLGALHNESEGQVVLGQSHGYRDARK
jgi:hypothetical protein